MKYKFDFIFSLGFNCGCTTYLRQHGLQEYSYPFDWLIGAPFETRIEMLLNNFEDFLNPAYLVRQDKGGGANKDNHYDYYRDIRTNLSFLHDFNPGGLGVSLSVVQAKYKRRIERLYEVLSSSKDVLCVWFSRDQYVAAEELLSAHKKLCAHFPKQNVYFLILENASGKTGYEYIDVSPFIQKVVYDNTPYDFSSPLSEVMGNIKATHVIFDKFSIKLTPRRAVGIIKKKFLMLSVKAASFFILDSDKRKEFRRKGYKNLDV